MLIAYLLSVVPWIDRVGMPCFAAFSTSGPNASVNGSTIMRSGFLSSRLWNCCSCCGMLSWLPVETAVNSMSGSLPSVFLIESKIPTWDATETCAKTSPTV